MVFRKQKNKEETAKLEEDIKKKMEEDKKELEALEGKVEEVEDTKEETNSPWKVGSVVTQTEPAIINNDKSYTIYEALAELLNRTEEY